VSIVKYEVLRHITLIIAAQFELKNIQNVEKYPQDCDRKWRVCEDLQGCGSISKKTEKYVSQDDWQPRGNLNEVPSEYMSREMMVNPLHAGLMSAARYSFRTLQNDSYTN